MLLVNWKIGSDEDNEESLESDSLDGYFGFGYITSTSNQGSPTKKRKGVELANINQPKKFISGGQVNLWNIITLKYDK